MTSTPVPVDDATPSAPLKMKKRLRCRTLLPGQMTPKDNHENADTWESNVDAEPAPEQDASSATTGGSSSDKGTKLQRQQCLIARRSKLGTLRYLNGTLSRFAQWIETAGTENAESTRASTVQQKPVDPGASLSESGPPSGLARRSGRPPAECCRNHDCCADEC